MQGRSGILQSRNATETSISSGNTCRFFFLGRLLLASEKVVRLFKTMNADHECWARRRIFKFFFLLNIHDTGCRTNTSITFLGCFNQLCLTCLRTRNTLFRGLSFRWHKLQQPLFLSINPNQMSVQAFNLKKRKLYHHNEHWHNCVGAKILFRINIGCEKVTKKE